jgi:hypothetical protein
MRSSKSRNRNKSNNNRRPSGNIINRVFDSSGPEGKVRGTPQQIIDKYNQLARDAQLAGDRVAVESFQQHAEHYSRMLSEAMREQAERQAQQDAQQAQANEGRRDRQGQDNQNRDQHRDQNRDRNRDENAPVEAVQDEAVTPQQAESVVSEGSSNLVETPEDRPARKPRARRPRAERKPKPEGATDGEVSVPTPEAAAPSTVE